MAHANVALFVPHAGCTHRCVFCDQRGISGARRMLPSDSEVAHTLLRAAESLGERTRSSEIAFFGGSFTAIPRAEMLRLLGAARPYLGADGFAGIRVSTRPDAVDDEVLAILQEYGVTAIELGAQSMDNNILSAIERGHTAEDVVRAAQRICGHGFSLGLQMMTGLPGDSDAGAIATAGKLAALGPDMVRIYPTLVLKNTLLADWWREGRYQPQELEEATALCGELLEFFHQRGIRVIRMGLHDAPDLRRDLLAGPYHPAFRELCEGRVLLRGALAALEDEDAPPGTVWLTVAEGSASRMAGQRRCNLRELARRGYQVKIVESREMEYLSVRVERGSYHDGSDCLYQGGL